MPQMTPCDDAIPMKIKSRQDIHNGRTGNTGYLGGQVLHSWRSRLKVQLAVFTGWGREAFHNEEFSHSKAKMSLVGSRAAGHGPHPGIKELRGRTTFRFREGGILAMMEAREVWASQGTKVVQMLHTQCPRTLLGFAFGQFWPSVLKLLVPRRSPGCPSVAPQEGLEGGQARKPEEKGNGPCRPPCL